MNRYIIRDFFIKMKHIIIIIYDVLYKAYIYISENCARAQSTVLNMLIISEFPFPFQVYLLTYGYNYCIGQLWLDYKIDNLDYYKWKGNKLFSEIIFKDLRKYIYIFIQHKWE